MTYNVITANVANSIDVQLAAVRSLNRAWSDSEIKTYNSTGNIAQAPHYGTLLINRITRNSLAHLYSSELHSLGLFENLVENRQTTLGQAVIRPRVVGFKFGGAIALARGNRQLRPGEPSRPSYLTDHCPD